MQVFGWICSMLGPVIGVASFAATTELLRGEVLLIGAVIFMVGDVALIITAGKED